jgi:hypothetical protein
LRIESSASGSTTLGGVGFQPAQSPLASGEPAPRRAGCPPHHGKNHHPWWRGLPARAESLRLRSTGRTAGRMPTAPWGGAPITRLSRKHRRRWVLPPEGPRSCRAARADPTPATRPLRPQGPAIPMARAAGRPHCCDRPHPVQAEECPQISKSPIAEWHPSWC